MNMPRENFQSEEPYKPNAKGVKSHLEQIATADINKFLGSPQTNEYDEGKELKSAPKKPLFPRIRKLAGEIQRHGIGVLLGRRYEEVTTFTTIVNPHRHEGSSSSILKPVATTRRVRV